MSKPGFITRKGASCYYLRAGSGGSFLNPQGDAEHKFHVEEERGGHVVGIYSLRGIEGCSWIPLGVRLAALRKIAACTPVCTEEWVQSVYNYFRHCYSPDGEDRNVGHCVVSKTPLDPARHLAYLHILAWFPESTPRLDLIESNGPLGEWSTTRHYEK